MPKPRKNEKRKDYIARCVPIVVREGLTPRQAVGRCHGMWRQSKKK